MAIVTKGTKGKDISIESPGVRILKDQQTSLRPENDQKPEQEKDKGARKGLRHVPKRMLQVIRRELRPTADQFRRIMELLRSRDADIEAYHEQVRASGVFNAPEYSHRIRMIQADSYDRLAQVLDSDQARRFGDLVARRLLPDAVAFEVDSSMVVLE